MSTGHKNMKPSGRRLKELRNNAGLSYQRLLDKLCVYFPNDVKTPEKPAVHYWENGGGCRDYVVYAYCQLFQCTPDYILGTSDDPLLTAQGWRFKQIDSDEKLQQELKKKRRSKLIEYVQIRSSESKHNCCISPSEGKAGTYNVEVAACSNNAYGLPVVDLAEGVASEDAIDLICDAVDRAIESTASVLCAWNPKPAKRYNAQELFEIFKPDLNNEQREGGSKDGKHRKKR